MLWFRKSAETIRTDASGRAPDQSTLALPESAKQDANALFSLPDPRSGWRSKMSTFLDWSRFNTGPVGPEKAFEAFTAQLFERWLRRTYNNTLTSYALHGEGGDGGVEAFARLSHGEVIGLQAKWFDGNL